MRGRDRSQGGVTRRRAPTARGGKGLLPGARPGRVQQRGDLGLGRRPRSRARGATRGSPRTAVRERSRTTVSAKKARSRGGSGGVSSSTTPSAPCSQRKFVSPSTRLGRGGDGELPEGHQVSRRASSSARRTEVDRGPASSSEPGELLQQLALARGELRRHLDDDLVARRRPGPARGGAACPCRAGGAAGRAGCPAAPSASPGPPSTGTSTSSPRAAWGKDSGSSQRRSAPSPHEDLVRPQVDHHVEVAGRAAVAARPRPRR